MQNKNNFILFLDKTFGLRAIGSFLTIGILTAVLYLSTFTFFLNIVHLNYRIAISIAYVVSILFHFNANRKFTFKAEGQAVAGQIVKYLTLVLINYVITLLVAHFVVEVLKWPAFIGAVCAIAATVGIGFTLSKFWIFRVA